MEYTVSQLAKISEISSRTLRYYDEIGLLKPAKINSSGYRIYEETEVDRLQQILFYRELDISLEEIKKIISEPTFNQTIALKDHYDNLIKKRAQLDILIATVEKTISYKKGEICMSNKDKFKGFKEKLIKQNEEKYGAEIRKKYGDDTIDASNAKLRDMSQAEYDKMKEIEKEVIDLLVGAFKTEDYTSDAAKKLVMKHKEWLMYSWVSYSKEAHIGLAEMYVADERFASYYNQHVEGGATFLREAIKFHVSLD